MTSSVFDNWHTYKFDWTPEATTFSIDGQIVRTLLASKAVGGGYPQTPCTIALSLWAGGDPTNRPGTIEWVGGKTDYSKGPFKMWIDSVKVINYTPAESYEYIDPSGNLSSIRINGGTLMSNGPTGSSPIDAGDEPSTKPSSSSVVPIASPTRATTSASSGTPQAPSSSSSATISSHSATASAADKNPANSTSKPVKASNIGSALEMSAATVFTCFLFTLLTLGLNFRI
jgi:beta-glucanase (GH16 family)